MLALQGHAAQPEHPVLAAETSKQKPGLVPENMSWQDSPPVNLSPDMISKIHQVVEQTVHPGLLANQPLLLAPRGSWRDAFQPKDFIPQLKEARDELVFEADLASVSQELRRVISPEAIKQQWSSRCGQIVPLLEGSVNLNTAQKQKGVFAFLTALNAAHSYSEAAEHLAELLQASHMTENSSTHQQPSAFDRRLVKHILYTAAEKLSLIPVKPSETISPTAENPCLSRVSRFTLVKNIVRKKLIFSKCYLAYREAIDKEFAQALRQEARRNTHRMCEDVGAATVASIISSSVSVSAIHVTRSVLHETDANLRVVHGLSLLSYAYALSKTGVSIMPRLLNGMEYKNTAASLRKASAAFSNR